MKFKKFFLFIALVFLFNISIAKSDFNNQIIAKIDNEIITNFDLINEINTILALSNKIADKEKIKEYQQMAFSNLKQIAIKKQAIEKYNIMCIITFVQKDTPCSQRCIICSVVCFSRCIQ